MKKLIIALTAAGCIAAIPAAVATAAPADGSFQVAQLDVRIGDGYHRRDYDRDRVIVRHRDRCRNVTVRERRGDRVIIRKTRRCF